jgi:hypothetical protein
MGGGYIFTGVLLIDIVMSELIRLPSSDRKSKHAVPSVNRRNYYRAFLLYCSLRHFLHYARAFARPDHHLALYHSIAAYVVLQGTPRCILYF